MSSFPTRDAIDEGPLTPVQYATLLRCGVESLVPSTDWFDANERRGVDYVYYVNRVQLETKLLIAADELFRASEGNRTRRGLVLTQAAERAGDVQPLRALMVNPTMDRWYRRESDWKAPQLDTHDAMVRLDRMHISRRLGNGDATRFLVTRAQRLVPVTTSSFSILTARTAEGEVVYGLKSTTTPPECGMCVWIGGVHRWLDGYALVRQTLQNGFVTAAPTQLRGSSGLLYSRQPDQTSGAVGRVAYTLDGSCTIYHFWLQDVIRTSTKPSFPRVVARAPPRPFLRTREAGGGSHELVNPFLNMRLDASAAPPAVSASATTSREATEKLLAVFFSRDYIDASVRRLVHKFGLAAVRAAFFEDPPPALPDHVRRAILSQFSGKAQLIDSRHQRVVLSRIANGQNWLFRLPIRTKTATYLEITKQLLAAKPAAKVLFVVYSNALGVALESAVTSVRSQFALGDLKLQRLVSGTGPRPERQALPRHSNVILTTPGMLDNLLSQADWNLTAFNLIIWDDCEKMTGFFVGNAVMRRYQQLPPSFQANIKVYAFTSHTTVPGTKPIRVQELCEKLAVPVRNCFLVYDNGDTLEAPPVDFEL